MRCGGDNREEEEEEEERDDITRPDLFPLSRVFSRRGREEGQRGAKKDRGKGEREDGTRYLDIIHR